MVEGTVKFFNKMRNYGFINGDDGKSYFVHGDALKGVEINEGDRVSFKAVEGDRGPKAEEVEKLEGKKEEKKEEEKEKKEPEKKKEK